MIPHYPKAVHALSALRCGMRAAQDASADDPALGILLTLEQARELLALDELARTVSGARMYAQKLISALPELEP